MPFPALALPILLGGLGALQASQQVYQEGTEPTKLGHLLNIFGSAGAGALGGAQLGGALGIGQPSQTDQLAGQLLSSGLAGPGARQQGAPGYIPQHQLMLQQAANPQNLLMQAAGGGGGALPLLLALGGLR